VIDARKIRDDFPVLQIKPYGKNLIYFDNAATTQKPESVIKAIENYYSSMNANVYRSAHYLSGLATNAYEQARNRVAKFINAGSESTVIFTRNASESINLVAYTWAMENIGEGDEIILSVAEHHSNMLPWQMVADKKGARLRYVYLDKEGRLDMSSFREMLTGKVKLVALQHVSNVLGIINPVEEITEMAHKAGAMVLIDGAQSVPHMKVDVKSIGCDFFAFSGHKMLGPMGIGVLYIRKELLSSIPPFLRGGEMIDEVYEDRSTFAEPPLKFEAGTPNVEGAVGLSAAIEYLEGIGLDNIRNHELELTQYALEKIREIDSVEIYGPLDTRDRGGVISFNVADIHPHDVSTILDQDGIAIRSGHHCAQPLMRYLGVPATCRASFYIYNDREEVDAFIESLKNVRKWFKWS
jgi:cysteine desulfurase (EC 2.8.1.7)